jgi:hypothetical protein
MQSVQLSPKPRSNESPKLTLMQVVESMDAKGQRAKRLEGIIRATDRLARSRSSYTGIGLE